MQLKILKKSDKDRNSQIILDETCRGMLPDRILLPLFPVPFCGDISQAQAEELVSLMANQAREQLFRYLAQSEHSSCQCREFLRRKLYQNDLVEDLIDRFVESKYIDDTRYVRMLISSLVERHKSRRAIVAKLKETCLPVELWEGIIHELFDPEESADALLGEVLNLRLRYRELPESKQRERIFASLYRKGFDLDDVIKAWQASRGR